MLMVLLWLHVFPSVAHAFHINEHLAITDRAVFGLQKCGLLPAAWDGNWKKIISSANADEDLSLRKLRYSHYYNPNHGIGQEFRLDSSASIADATQEMKDLVDSHDANGFYALVGRTVHHLQDAATPPHAVPVAHWMNDGFETFDMTYMYAEPIAPEECGGLAPAEPMELLRATALDTLQSITEPFTYARNGETGQTTWGAAFWVPSEREEFGQYGELGNHFGEVDFSPESDVQASVPIESYDAFKRARIRAAVRATQAAILWANREFGL